MNKITHQQQQDRWDKEHKKPNVLPQMDSASPSSGVLKFCDWLKDTGVDPKKSRGMEICCGKGRNVIWFAQQGANMIGIDFSPAAIEVAQKRANKAGVKDKTRFLVQDATLPYPIDPSSLDFAFDCFGSTDIESVEGRKEALKNVVQVLKPGGYLMVYLLSSEDEFQKEMASKSPGPDKGSFIHAVNGKYEKAFSEDEVREFYKDLKLCEFDRISKTDSFFGKKYDANHIWAVFQKP